MERVLIKDSKTYFKFSEALRTPEKKRVKVTLFFKKFTDHETSEKKLFFKVT